VVTVVSGAGSLIYHLSFCLAAPVATRLALSRGSAIVSAQLVDTY
jgi:hypothetical protein